MVLVIARPELGNSQGLVLFRNDTNSLVLNTLTGAPASLSAGIQAALYYAPDGETNLTTFVQLGDSTMVGLPVPGAYVGGVRTTPTTTPPLAPALFQVRAWETAYGQTFEDAVTAPPMNGRLALAGVSSVLRVETGAEGIRPPASLTANGLTPIILVSDFFAPRLTIDDELVAEGTNGTATARFAVRLNFPSDEVASVDFATSDGTAVAGQDYVSTNGSLSFEPGETFKEITVVVTGDVPAEPEETFRMTLSNPVNIGLLRSQATCTITEMQIVGMRMDHVVKFDSVVGLSYMVERSDDSVHWTNILGASPVHGNGGTIAVRDVASGCSPTRQYRLRLVH